MNTADLIDEAPVFILALSGVLLLVVANYLVRLMRAKPPKGLSEEQLAEWLRRDNERFELAVLMSVMFSSWAMLSAWALFLQGMEEGWIRVFLQPLS